MGRLIDFQAYPVQSTLSILLQDKSTGKNMGDVVEIISQAKRNALKKVKEELILTVRCICDNTVDTNQFVGSIPA